MCCLENQSIVKLLGESGGMCRLEKKYWEVAGKKRVRLSLEECFGDVLLVWNVSSPPLPHSSPPLALNWLKAIFEACCLASCGVRCMILFLFCLLAGELPADPVGKRNFLVGSSWECGTDKNYQQVEKLLQKGDFCAFLWPWYISMNFEKMARWVLLS